MRYDAPSGESNSDKFTVDYGAGLKYSLIDHIALRADVRHVLPLNERYNDPLYSFGITFSFGGAAKGKQLMSITLILINQPSGKLTTKISIV